MKNIKLAMPSLKDARMRRGNGVPTIRYKLEDKYANVGTGKTYHIFTYGCQGNEADSEVMAGILEQVGFVKSNDPMNSDLVILNTCAIRENAEQRIWGVLGQLKGRKREKPDMLIYIGEITGDYYSVKIGASTEVWRVSSFIFISQVLMVCFLGSCQHDKIR